MSALRTRVIRRCDRDHYEELHRTSVKYRENNWLLDDLLVSADVLEHLPPPVLPDVIRRLHACGRRCFHKIACYDDGHSHLTVSSPRRWLRLFEESATGNAYRIVNVARRNGRRSKPVLVISNMESAVSG